MLFWKLSRNKTYISMCVKSSEIHFNVLLFYNPGEKVLILIENTRQICPQTLDFLGPSFLHWRTTINGKGFPTIFQECWHICFSWKIVGASFQCIAVLQDLFCFIILKIKKIINSLIKHAWSDKPLPRNLQAIKQEKKKISQFPRVNMA